jgi:membrane protein implicated in regulation of membrane protease activity
MIVLGIILLVLGVIIPVGILKTLGIILIVVGVVLTLLGSAGRGIGGRRTYF